MSFENIKIVPAQKEKARNPELLRKLKEAEEKRAKIKEQISLRDTSQQERDEMGGIIKGGSEEVEKYFENKKD